MPLIASPPRNDRSAKLLSLISGAAALALAGVPTLTSLIPGLAAALTSTGVLSLAGVLFHHGLQQNSGWSWFADCKRPDAHRSGHKPGNSCTGEECFRCIHLVLLVFAFFSLPAAIRLFEVFEECCTIWTAILAQQYDCARRKSSLILKDCWSSHGSANSTAGLFNNQFHSALRRNETSRLGDFIVVQLEWGLVERSKSSQASWRRRV